MAKKKTKKCSNKWIGKEVVREVRNMGSAYWGELSEAKTQAGTMNKAFLSEARCHGLKVKVERAHARSGYKPELHLVRIKGRKVKYPY